MAYSFYIKNTGAETVSLDYSMRLTQVDFWMEDYIRILIIEDNVTQRMYQKEDQLDLEGNMPQYDQMPIGINFESDSVIFSETIEDLKPGTVKSFRVIIWLEEKDPDMSEQEQSGSIQAELVFIIRDEYPEVSNKSSLLLSTNENLWFQILSQCVVNFDIHHETEGTS